MIEFKDILETCQVEAIANKVSPTEDGVWRSMCRKYSESFHTPLHLVLDMDPEHVILNVYEKQLEDVDIEDQQKLDNLLDIVLSIEDPAYEIARNAEQEEFDKQAEEEERDRLKKGLPVYQPRSKKTLLKKEKEVQENRPTQGSINLGYLAKLDGEER